MPPLDRFVNSTEFYVRYVETDQMRIVNHAHYISWLEESRSEYARARGSDYADFEREGVALAVVEVHVNYKSPARYGDRIRVTCWIEELKSRLMRFSYEVHNAKTGLLLVTATTRHVCINLETGAAAVIPEKWRTAMLE
jgi:acyl-CoA thioester hydrolase